MAGFRSLLPRINFKLCIYLFCALLPFLLSPLCVAPDKETRCSYVILIVTIYWFLEPIPIAVTALIPVILFPVLGVVSSTEICANYMKESFMMFIGGLIVAVAVEDCKLHERIALKVLLIVGTEIKWLLLGFMITTMFLSMWISNTATTAMMVPIAEAIISKISRKKRNDLQMEENKTNICGEKSIEDPEIGDSSYSNETSASPVKVGLFLSVCYAANIGGTGTLTGTGPNIVFKGLMEDLHPKSEDITFASWMIYNVPGMLLCVLIGWIYLWLVYVRFSKNHNLESKSIIKGIITKKYADLGPMSVQEGQVLGLFVALVLLWIFRDPKFVPGWSDAIGSETKIMDSVPAIFIAFLLFFLPANPRDPGGKPILEWKTVQLKLPWGVLILIGGGFALADAAKKSGLSQLIGEKMLSLNVLSPGVMIAVLCIMTAMLTEIMSNTTTATILLPVFNEMALTMGIHPIYLMLPVTVVCSYAFMLPVATPPNAIAFESANMRTVDMAKPGIFMNIMCCAVQLLMINTLGITMFDLNNFPSWATGSIRNATSGNFTLEVLENATSLDNFTLYGSYDSFTLRY